MFILLINDVVMSYRRCKGTAVLGDREIFRGLLPEVVATGTAIGDKTLTRGQNRVATQNFMHGFTYWAQKKPSAEGRSKTMFI
jgi:hypothetical protein